MGKANSAVAAYTSAKRVEEHAKFEQVPWALTVGTPIHLRRSAHMNRYYLHARFDDGFELDRVGHDCPSLDDTIVEAGRTRAALHDGARIG